MLQEEHEASLPYWLRSPYSSPASVMVLDDASVAQIPKEQNAFQPPRYPLGPQALSTPPNKRPGRAGAMLLLTLVLALIFGVGLFAGCEFTSSSRSNTATTSQSVTTASEASTAAVNPGNSGGALVNLQGQLIGIPTLTAVNSESNTTANGVSFAIPSNLVATVVHQILQQ
jgi:Trypsin